MWDDNILSSALWEVFYANICVLWAFETTFLDTLFTLALLLWDVLHEPLRLIADTQRLQIALCSLFFMFSPPLRRFKI